MARRYDVNESCKEDREGALTVAPILMGTSRSSEVGVAEAEAGGAMSNPVSNCPLPLN